MGGDRYSRLNWVREWLLERIAREPDLTLEEIRLVLAREQQHSVSYGCVQRFVTKERLTFKKTLYASEHDRPDVAAAPALWRESQAGLPIASLVFIDETWVKTNMVRSRGRCLRGQRLIGKVPHAHWITSTLVAALQSDALTAPCIFDGPINGDFFKAYVEQCLAPTLSPDDIVVMVNLGSHKSAEIQAAIAARGASQRYLPAYSPDLNPIEMVFPKLKARLRRAAERSIDALWHRVGALLRDFSLEECAAYFRADGYAPP